MSQSFYSHQSIAPNPRKVRAWLVYFVKENPTPPTLYRLAAGRDFVTNVDHFLQTAQVPTTAGLRQFVRRVVKNYDVHAKQRAPYGGVEAIQVKSRHGAQTVIADVLDDGDAIFSNYSDRHGEDNKRYFWQMLVLGIELGLTNGAFVLAHDRLLAFQPGGTLIVPLTGVGGATSISDGLRIFASGGRDPGEGNPWVIDLTQRPTQAGSRQLGISYNQNQPDQERQFWQHIRNTNLKLANNRFANKLYSGDYTNANRPRLAGTDTLSTLEKLKKKHGVGPRGLPIRRTTDGDASQPGGIQPLLPPGFTECDLPYPIHEDFMNGDPWFNVLWSEDPCGLAKTILKLLDDEWPLPEINGCDNLPETIAEVKKKMVRIIQETCP